MGTKAEMEAERKKLIKKRTNKSLAVYTLNVGDGDAIIIQFPTIGDLQRPCAVVDCYDADKTIQALKDLEVTEIPFVCATHPHYDHTKGIKKLLEWTKTSGIKVSEFWDSGFRHVSKTHYDIITWLFDNTDIQMIQPTSGYETAINNVRIRVLSPSIYLKNHYDTFGTNINNASIVIKLEYPATDVTKYYTKKNKNGDEEIKNKDHDKRNSIILGADAQFDAWARITQEFPHLVSTSNQNQLIEYKKVRHRPLKCQVFKAPHHLSKHGLSLEVVEMLRPQFTIGSLADKSHHGFPHELAVKAVVDIKAKKTKDKGVRYTGHHVENLRGGTIVALFQGDGKRPTIISLKDTKKQNALL